MKKSVRLFAGVVAMVLPLINFAQTTENLSGSFTEGTHEICKPGAVVLSPTPQDSFNVSGNASFIIQSATEIHLMPGFHAGGFTNGGSFHAMIVSQCDDCSNVIADAGEDKNIQFGGQVLIGSEGEDSLTYSWTPSESLSATNIANPVASPTKNTTYILTVSKGGCPQDKDTVTITVIPYECGNENGEPTEYSISSGCNNLNNYFPQPDDELKVIRVNVHIMQKNDGSGSFVESDSVVENYFYKIFSLDTENPSSSQNRKHAYNPSPISVDADTLYGIVNYYVPDTKIRFKLVGVYFHHDTLGWANNSTGILSSNAHFDDYAYNHYAINKETEANIFLVRIAPGTPTRGRGPFGSGYVVIAGNWDNVTNFGPNLLNHELGHATGNLWHTVDRTNGSSFTVGRTLKTSNGEYYNNSDYWMNFGFSAGEAWVLKSVNVYANGSGNRTFLLDSNGVTLYQQTIFVEDEITHGGAYTVNFDSLEWLLYPCPSCYTLKTSGNPNLWRDTTNTSYPLANNGNNGYYSWNFSLTGTNDSENRYYSFYNLRFSDKACPRNTDNDFNTGVHDTYFPDPTGWYEAGHVSLNCGSPIYVTTNNVMNYSQSQNHLSPQQLGRFHLQQFFANTNTTISLTSNTYNESMRFLDCETQRTDLPVTIATGMDTIWTLARIMTGNLTVDSGAVLTIQCIVGFPPGTKAIVKRGGRLIIDGGQLYSSCGSIWEGVEVWGNPAKGQGYTNLYGQISSYNAYQGMIEMKNGARISHAICAVQLSKSGDCCGYNGGIIRAKDSYFTNNRKSVSFMKYKFSSFSNFDNVEFKCDKPMRSDAYLINGRRLGVNGFVSLWDIRGVNFKDCEFKNNVSYTYQGDTLQFDPDIRGTGIGSIDAQYTVTSTDITVVNTRSQFDSLSIGVHTGSTFKNLRAVKIENCMFRKTQQGILSEGGTNNKFIGNRFRVPQSYFPLLSQYPIFGYGIYMKHSYNTTVTDNTFEYASNTPGTAFNWGIINGGWEWNISNGGLIKNNQFKNIDWGTQVELNNPHLKISCNEYTNQEIEWWINPQYHSYFLGPQGAGCFVSQTRADNLFYDSGQHIWSYAQFWKYWAPNVANATPIFATPPINGDTAICININTRNCIPDTGGGHVIGNEKALKADLDSAFAILKNEFDNVSASLDDGQTDTLLARIGRSSYSNETLTNELLINSFLSDEVLIATCKRSPFFNYNQFVSIVNKNSPVSNEVWAAVKDAYKEYAAPPDTLINAQLTDTLRTLTTIKREIDRIKTDLFLTENNIISLYAEAEQLPELIDYLTDTLGGKDYKKLAIGVCLQTDTAERAEAILNTIDLDDKNDSAFYDYYSIAVNLAKNNLSWFGISEMQKNKIKELALSNYEVAINAQTVLRLVDDSIYFRIPEIAVDSSGKWDGKPSYQNQQTAPEENALRQFSIYPNPFSNSFNVQYSFEKEIGNLRIEVYDVVGRIVKTQVIGKAHAGTVSVDLGQCLGFYYVQLLSDNTIFHKDKVICVSR